MNSKDFDKMLDIMNSLEPSNPRTVQTDEIGHNTLSPYTNLEMENSSFSLKPRKQSLPLSQSNLSLKSYALGRRQSLFQNERSYSNTSLHKLRSCPLNKKGLIEIPTEKKYLNFTGEVIYKNVIMSSKSVIMNDSNANILSSNETTFDDDLYSNNSHETMSTCLIDGRKPRNLVHRNSLEILKMKKSKLSESIDCTLPVEDKKDDDEYKHNLLPLLSLEDSPTDWPMDYKEASSSVESHTSPSESIISQCSRNEIKSTESASEGISSNPCASPEIQLYYPNKESPVIYHPLRNPLYSPRIQQNQSGVSRKSEGDFKLHTISNIISEEEQNKLYRRMSVKLSLDTFSVKEIIKVYTRSGVFSAQIIDKYQTAGSICRILKQKFCIPEERLCQIVEVITKESLERPLEEHELMLAVFSSWNDDSSCNRFIFEEHLHNYKIFEHPRILSEEQKYEFEVSDLMWIKAVNSKWIRATCFIKENCIYYSAKQGSKDQKDIYCLINLQTSNFYTSCDFKKIKKELKAPTVELIIFKENKCEHQVEDNAYLAPMTAQQREKWLEAMAVAKFSFRQLKINHVTYRTRTHSEIKSKTIDDATGGDHRYHEEPKSI